MSRIATKVVFILEFENLFVSFICEYNKHSARKYEIKSHCINNKIFKFVDSGNAKQNTTSAVVEKL